MWNAKFSIKGWFGRIWQKILKDNHCRAFWQEKRHIRKSDDKWYQINDVLYFAVIICGGCYWRGRNQKNKQKINTSPTPHQRDSLIVNDAFPIKSTLFQPHTLKYFRNKNLWWSSWTKSWNRRGLSRQILTTSTMKYSTSKSTSMKNNALLDSHTQITGIEKCLTNKGLRIKSMNVH